MEEEMSISFSKDQWEAIANEIYAWAVMFNPGEKQDYLFALVDKIDMAIK